MVVVVHQVAMRLRYATLAVVLTGDSAARENGKRKGGMEAGNWNAAEAWRRGRGVGR